jgi:predicted transcriptional regulator
MCTVFSLAAFAAPPMGEKPKTLTLEKNEGGRVTGEAWNSDELKGKVFVLFYVDPDFSDLNNAASEALKAEKFPKEKYQSLAVINMGATWLPNFAIDGKLKAKQKDYPDTIYVRDIHKTFVKEWKMADDNNDIIAFDQEGKIIFAHEGKLDEATIKKLIETVKSNFK